MIELINSDCLEAMKKMADNSIDFCVTDSPYGISFMSKQWDKEIPPCEYWKEMLRVVKPGGHLCCAGLPRMIHRLGCIVEDSGWTIRDMIMHIFGQGFPKSNNHFGLEGYGTALKPAWEGWILAMKPLDGTYAQNVQKWGIGGINIDESRIPTDEKWIQQCQDIRNNGLMDKKDRLDRFSKSHEKGRWPSNLLLDEEAAQLLDQQSGFSKGSKNGIRKAGSELGQKSSWNKHENKNTFRLGHNDFGGASRFFFCAKASTKERNAGLEGMPEKYKGAPDGENCDNTLKGPGNALHPDKNSKSANFHPTVKPIALMKYIIKLLAPPNNPTLLDPFCGSGSTLIAAKELGINAIGIELNPEYCEIAKKRIDRAQFKPDQLELFTK